MIETLQLCLVCLRVGALVFGGGLVMVPLLEADVVVRYEWLTRQQFLDAVALGQMTPGPLLVTATLIGYKVSGLLGATLATLCMFLPSFLMTVVLARHLQRVQGHPLVKRFLWGARSAVVGLILAAGVSLGYSHLTAIGPLALGAAGLGLMLFTEKADPSLVVLGSGLIGLALWSGS